MGLSLGCNEKLCVVIDVDLFDCMVRCAGYSEEFLYNRVCAFIKKGVPSGSTNSIAQLARKMKSLKLTETAVKYIVSKQYVISRDITVGSFVAGHKPYAILSREGDNIKVGGGIKL